jgi:Divergent InlB B-repeat domain/Bacterial Ig domain
MQVLCLAVPLTAIAADLNVLVIGSTKDSSEVVTLSGATSKAFNPIGITNELKKILSGAGLGTVNVVLIDRSLEQAGVGYLSYKPTSLAAWFHWPWPTNTEFTARWPNLRGELGTAWDYVVLIGDSATIEYVPGLYTCGVADIAKEVAKGTNGAETILLMPWPASTSSSTLNHYKEVVYRTGRTGGYKVAPGGLAWQACGSPTTTNQHPNSDGAYIAAASIYSRIWNKSATNSTYNPKPSLANTVYTTVTNAVNTPQYSGKFDNKTIFRFHSPSERVYAREYGAATIVSSTEDNYRRHYANASLHMGGTLNSIFGNYGVSITRYTPDRDASYTWGFQRTYGDGNDGDFAQEIILWDTLSGPYSYQRSNDSAVPPTTYPTMRRMAGALTFARAHQYRPDLGAFYGGHGAHEFCMSAAALTIAQITAGGRTAVDSIADTSSFKAGYETAMQLATCSVRVPGFQAKPESLTIGYQYAEPVSVRFLYPPQSNVTVTISSPDGLSIPTPSTLTFTPTNYNVIQYCMLSPTPGTPRGTNVIVEFTTSSGDEVFDGIIDKWPYRINLVPSVADVAAVTYKDQLTTIVLKGTDPENEPKTYRVVEPPKDGDVVINGGLAVYTPRAGFVGIDSFTYLCSDTGDDSNTGKVTVSVFPVDGDFNLLQNPGAELPLTENGWVIGLCTWQQWASSSIEGLFQFTCANIGWGQVASLYQDVDVSRYAARIANGDQSFRLSGFIRGTLPTLRAECRNAQGAVLSTLELATGGSSMTYAEGTIAAPVGTTSIRVVLHSTTGTYWDELGLFAVKPPNIAPVAIPQTNVTVTAGVANDIVLTATDVDGDELSYIIVNPPQRGSISGGLGANRVYTPNAGYTGPDSLIFKVLDGKSESGEAMVSFDVVANQAPVIVLDSPTTNATAIPQNVDLMLRTTVRDDGMPGAVTCAWSVVSGPVGQTVVFAAPSSADTGVSFSNVVGTYVLRLTASDGEFTTTRDVSVEVGLYDDTKNMGAFIYHLDNYAGAPGVPLPLTGATAGDDGKPIDPGAITIAWQQVSGPAPAEFADPTVQEPVVTFSQVGAYVLRMLVSDGEVEDYNDIPVTISAAGNLAPVARAAYTPAAPVKGGTVMLSAAGSLDPNLDAITYAWVQTAGSNVTLSAANTVAPTFVAPARGTYTFELTVSDGSLSSTTTVDVVVVNAAPVVNAGNAQTAALADGAPLAWTPKMIATAAWYDAADPEYLNWETISGTVLCFKDKSGNTNDMWQTSKVSRPICGTATIGGLPAVSFNQNTNTGHRIIAPDAPSLRLDASGGVNIFMVMNYSSWPKEICVPFSKGCTISGSFGYGITYQDDPIPLRFSSGTKVSAGREYFNEDILVAGISRNSDTNDLFTALRVGGTQKAFLAAKAVSDTASPLTMGSDSDPQRYMRAYASARIGEALVVGGNLPLETVEKLEGYLAHKWGLQASLPTNHPCKISPPSVPGPGAVVNLSGSVTDPDDTNVSVFWSTVSSPGGAEVFFTNRRGLNTAATLPAAGTYVLRMTADDGTSQVSSDVVITVTDGVTHTITASAGVGGAIAPHGPVVVYEGSDQVFAITPNTGYSITNVLVDGVSVGTVGSYTFTNVTAAHTIAASFAINQYTVTFDIGPNGTRSDGGALVQTVAHGSAATAPIVSPNANYLFLGWDAVFTNVTSNLTVHARIALNIPYTLTYTAGAHGSISGVSPQTVGAGADGTAVTAVPDAGYLFVSWSDGSTVNPRTDNSVVADVTVTANFVLDPVVVVNQEVVPQDTTSATLYGEMTDGTSGSAWICWGTADGGTASTGSWQNVVSVGAVTEGASFSSLVTGLSTNTTYFFRCYALSASGGTAWSDAATTFSGAAVAPEAAWSLTNITLAAWYDASDTNALSTVGSSVTNMLDKSGNNRHLAQATSNNWPTTGTRTIGGLNVLDFDGTNDRLTRADGMPVNDATLILLFQPDVAAGGNRPFANDGTQGSGSIQCILDNGGAAFGYTPSISPTNPVTINTAAIIVAGVQDLGTNSLEWVVRDGGALASTNFSRGATSTSIALGGKVGGSYSYNGVIGEAIVIAQNIDTATRQKIEGYLAHKWGLTANLPAAHRYKTTAPDGAAMANLAPTGISDTAATFNGLLRASGTNADVRVYYGTTDAGTNAASWTSSALVGSWTNVSTNISHAVSGLAAGQTYYYTFMASNAAGRVWASPSWTFTTAPAGGPTHAITATAGTGGTITPSGAVVVNEGANRAFTITANTGYSISNVTVDSVAIGAVGSYTFMNVMAPHTIAATFAINQYTVTFDVGTNGTHTGGGALVQAVNHGSAATAPTITPNVNYLFLGWDAAFTNVTGNLTVHAQYALNIQYTLTYTAGAHGSVSGTSPQTVNAGANGTAVTAVPDAGYLFVSWSDGSTANPRTDTSVGANLNVTANFALDPVVVLNQGAVAVDTTSARLSGVLTNGSAASAWICWGTADSGTASTSDWQHVVSMGAVTKGVAFTNLVTGLSANTTYFYRCYVLNASGGSDWSDAATAFSGTPAGNVGGGGWSMTNITTVLWYDAADTNSLTIADSTNHVSQWRDKSGNSNHVSQGTATAQPTYTGGRVSFDGGDLLLKTTGPTVSQPLTFIVVTKPSNMTANKFISDCSGTRLGCGIVSTTPNSLGLLDASSSSYLGAYTTTGTEVMMAGVCNGASSYTRINGTQNATGNIGTDGVSGNFALGGRTTGSYNYIGSLAEFILLPSGDINNIQKIEGYLAHKWGLTANLPSDHPYKTTSPAGGGGVANLAPTGISDTAATFNGALNASGTNYDVRVYYGTTDAGTNAASWTSSALVGSWTNVSTNVSYAVSGLTAGTTYYYTFMASNAAGRVWASPSWTFTTPGAARTVTVNHAVPYAWLAARNALWSNDYEAAVTNDVDGDGFTTWQEYWSGTDPVNSNSFLRIDSVALEGGNAVLTWQHAVVGAGVPPLAIQTTTNLQSGPWVTTDQKAPANGTNTWSGATALQQLFYRLAVTNAP